MQRYDDSRVRRDGPGMPLRIAAGIATEPKVAAHHLRRSDAFRRSLEPPGHGKEFATHHRIGGALAARS